MNELKNKIKRTEHFKVYAKNNSYLVGDRGTIYSLHVMRPIGSVSFYGYWCVNIGGKSIAAHRILYETWVGQIPEGMTINHKSGVKLQNTIENIEVMTQSENSKHASDVLGLRKKGKDHHLWAGNWEVKGERFTTLKEAREVTGYSIQTIRSKCKSGLDGFDFIPAERCQHMTA